MQFLIQLINLKLWIGGAVFGQLLKLFLISRKDCHTSCVQNKYDVVNNFSHTADDDDDGKTSVKNRLSRSKWSRLQPIEETRCQSFISISSRHCPHSQYYTYDNELSSDLDRYAIFQLSRNEEVVQNQLARFETHTSCSCITSFKISTESYSKHQERQCHS